MDNLPFVALIKIFKFLSFKDRIRCSLVCRSWRNKILINYDHQKSLFLHFNLFPYNLRDSFDTELVKYENSIQLQNLKFLTSKLMGLYFRNLKKLSIYNIERYKINVPNLGDCVNHFDELEQLSLNKLRLNERTTIKLKKLKMLSLRNVRIDSELELNTCQLETLICWSNLNKIRFHYPTKLTNLEYKYSNLELNPGFCNLEFLKYFNESGLTKTDFLGNFRKLRNLIVYTPFIEHDLKELKKQKQKYKLEKLEISSFGFRDDFIYFPINRHYVYLLDQFKLKELFNNYSKLNSSVSFPVQIDFCSIIDNFLSIPNDFFRKFTQIAQVNVCWNSSELIKNFSSLIQFLRNCGFLPRLVLNSCGFGQNFFDELSLNASIGELQIQESDLKFESYRFISTLILFDLKIHLNNLPVDLIRNALCNRNLKYFEFNKKNTQILTKSHQNHHLDLEINHQYVNEFDSQDSLIYCLRMNKQISPFLV